MASQYYIPPYLQNIFTQVMYLFILYTRCLYYRVFFLFFSPLSKVYHTTTVDSSTTCTTPRVPPPALDVQYSQDVPDTNQHQVQIIVNARDSHIEISCCTII